MVAPPTPVMDSCTISRSSCGCEEMVSMETSSVSMAVPGSYVKSIISLKTLCSCPAIFQN